MEDKRFYYTKSMVYGWAVYDRQTNQPAWDACAEILPPVYDGENGKITVDPCCETEYQAMRLCSRLNLMWKKHSKEE